ncbi:hypothetical protein A2U01_0001598 [Trifolium medium]|uniref:RRM domain-containing protein n=1 Tax=Trifolium medium TaxID=97028 RepID=A0A392M2I8_9FABA|nr:hypothetical protein [Trifolium medium]
MDLERERDSERERDLEGWTCVRPRRRRGSRLDQDKAIKNSITNTGAVGSTTCYVNNLPEDVGQKEVERMFERWGKVVDVYIAKKRNKMGKVFGFVRYANVKDERWLESQLRDIWFGTYKVWVNISRFEKPNKKFQYGETSKEANGADTRKKEQRTTNVSNNTKNYARRGQSVRREGKTFAEAIQNKETVQKKEVAQRDEIKVDSGMEGTSLSVTIKEEEMAWAKQGFVGFVRNIEEIDLLQQRMVDEGITTVRVIPMGGEKVFIKADENEDLKTLIREAENFFQQLFSVVRQWEPRDSTGARCVWIRAFGVPVHAWRRSVFSLLTNSVGRLIKIDQITENMERLDVARLFVRTSILEAINKVIKIRINNECFTIRITEEMCDCGVVEVEEEQECDENSEEDGVEVDSVNSDETLVPPSISTMEDEENLQKIEENFEKIMEEENDMTTLNVGSINQQTKELNVPQDTNRMEENNHLEKVQEINGVGDKGTDDGGHVGLKGNGELFNISGVDHINGGTTHLMNGASDIGQPLEELSPINQLGAYGPYEEVGTKLVNHNLANKSIGLDGPQLEGPTQSNIGAVNTRTSEQKVDLHLNQDQAQREVQRSTTSNTHIVGASREYVNGAELVDKQLTQNGTCDENQSIETRNEVAGRAQSPKEIRKRRIDILREKKKKAIRKGKKEESRCTCSQRSRTQNQVNTNSNILLFENEADRNNWVILHGEAKEVARNVWDLGRDYGLIHKGEEGEILQELTIGVKGGEVAP